MHNDDYTTMDFVVEVLNKVFHKTPAEAETIMMAIHSKGIGVCGIYTAEVAETRVAQVRRMAKGRGFPLLCTMEEV
ncbi:MAG: ATP-dependent Clp protease adaptor ClpS [Deltaproteobacteria bacterium]|nr:ATP-dependent Clp protease adaptor ClpS [Deltaproteobacteria bacterium]